MYLLSDSSSGGSHEASYSAMKTKRIIRLEIKLAQVRTQHDRAMAFLALRGVENVYDQDSARVINKSEPTLKKRCLDLIDKLGAYTEAFGFDARSDYAKAVAYMILGKCLGEDLEDWSKTPANDNA